MPAPLLDAVPVVTLGVLLTTAVLHPRERVEAAVGALAAAAVLAVGALEPDAAGTEIRRLLPVVAFLVAILVVAECCRAAGVFRAIGDRLAGAAPQRLFLGVFVVATLVTVVLSLDATVVLLTPVALAAAVGPMDRPLGLVCVRLANSASLLLPVSNLTNLLALPHLDLGFARFALLMGPAWLLALALEYAVHQWWFRESFRATVPEHRNGTRTPLPAVPLVIVALMLAGFVVGSAYDLDPAWVAGIAALALVVRGLSRQELDVRRVAASTHLSFAIFVLGLGTVVAALAAGPAGDLVARLAPDGDGLGSLLVVAVLGAVLANLLNNLPATLLLVPLLAASPLAVLAALIGINLGSSMTWTGSLANLLWRRTVTRSDGEVSSRDFHVVGLLVTPAAIAAGVLALHLTGPLVLG